MSTSEKSFITEPVGEVKSLEEQQKFTANNEAEVQIYSVLHSFSSSFQPIQEKWK